MAGMRLETSATQRVKWRLPQMSPSGWLGKAAASGSGSDGPLPSVWRAARLRCSQRGKHSKRATPADACGEVAGRAVRAGGKAVERRQAGRHRAADRRVLCDLPPHDAIPDQLKQLINLAEKNGVMLVQAEYKPQAEVDAGFLRYQIVLPVKAAYPSIQTFMLNALQALPTLTLESVAFKRDRIESAEVEARIHFMLLVKKPAAKGAGK